jgi:hypothetical protein
MLLRRAQGWGYSCGRRYIMTQRPFATCGIIVGNRLFQSPQSHDLQACHHIRDRSQLLLDLALFCHMLKSTVCGQFGGSTMMTSLFPAFTMWEQL